MKPETLPIYLTTDEAADLLRTTQKAIYARIERRQLPGVRKIGKKILIHSGELVEWIDQQAAPSLHGEKS